MADIKIHSKTISDRNNRAQIDLQRESRLIRFVSINIYIYIYIYIYIQTITTYSFQ